MKIDFEDGSFLEILFVGGSKLSFTLCARQDFNKVTMTSIDLSPDQTKEVIEFLTNRVISPINLEKE